MKRRWQYIIRFWDAKPIRVSAINETQATIIAKAIAAKHGWKLQQVGIVR